MVNTVFADLDCYDRLMAADVINAYIDGPVDAETDPIKFWVSCLDKPGAKASPRGVLARMGLDFASAPGGRHLLYLSSYTYLSFSNIYICRTSLFSWWDAGVKASS